MPEADLPRGKSGRSAIEVATRAAHAAGSIIYSQFRQQHQIHVKGVSNLVTDTDVQAEKAAIDILYDEFPDHNVLSEESRPDSEVGGFTWVIDPLDGTNNYVFGIPFLCVNIALATEHEILAGVTHDPLGRETFHAVKGGGSFVNGTPVRVSSRDSLQSSMLGLDMGYDMHRGEETLELARKLRRKAHTLRVLGSSSLGLAYVACGRIDLYYHRYLFPWDIASGLLLVREAGGEVTDWNGNPAGLFHQELVASNRGLCAEFLRIARP